MHLTAVFRAESVHKLKNGRGILNATKDANQITSTRQCRQTVSGPFKCTEKESETGDVTSENGGQNKKKKK